MDRPANFGTKKWTLFGLCLLSIVQMAVLVFVIYEILKNGMALNETIAKELVILALASIITAIFNVIGVIASQLRQTWLVLIFILLNCISGLLFLILSCAVPNIWAISATSIVTSVMAIAFYRDLKKITLKRTVSGVENEALIE